MDPAIEIKNQALRQIEQAKNLKELENLRIEFLGRKGKVNQLFKKLPELKGEEKLKFGQSLNEAKEAIERAVKNQQSAINNQQSAKKEFFDVTLPGKKPPQGHLHLVTQAIKEISAIFEKIGFIRVRYPEVEWDWYAFEGLNMPPEHPARDEWETFFIDAPSDNEAPRANARGIFSSLGGAKSTEAEDRHSSTVSWFDSAHHPELAEGRPWSSAKEDKKGSIVLTPHTSSGQLREMERVKKPPIKMINIAKCYRRQQDVIHTVMFHQFEGLLIDKNVSIAHLKGVTDYFAQQFYGKGRKTRLRPFHFQFTEPSFEVDINCPLCLGKGCKTCKSGWHELGGAGMVHPRVLRAGGIDPGKYSGFAFGWGVERTYMMKAGIKIDDLRIFYENDLRFLEQF